MSKPGKTAWKQNLEAFMEKIKTSRLWQSPGKWIGTHKAVSILGGLFVVLMIAAVTVSGSKKSEAEEYTVVETITIIGNSKTTAEDTLTEESPQEQQITALVARYFTALAACDIETLNNICETMEAFDAEVLAEHASYIEGYRDIDCTIMDGLVEGTYVVYVYYEIKFYYIDTPAPALVQLYIKTDTDGMPYIYQGIIDGELSAYIAELTAGEEISRLADEVNRKLQIACTSDPDLDAFIRALQNQDQEASEKNSRESESLQQESEGADRESTPEDEAGTPEREAESGTVTEKTH